MAPRPIPGPLLVLACVALTTTWFTSADAQFEPPTNLVAEELGVIDITFSAVFNLPVTALVADMTNLPPNSGATFTPGPDNVTGTFHWAPGTGMAGTYAVIFRATLSNGWLYTRQTTIYVVAAGTTALARGEFTWIMPEDGVYDASFVASDQYGTSTLTVPVTMIIRLNCYPDSRGDIGPAQSTQSPPRRAGYQQGLTTNAPNLSWWGKTDGGAFCLFYTYWEEPVDLHVEAISTTPESNLALTDISNLTCWSNNNACGFSMELYARDPRVTALETVQGGVNTPLTINVDASDPDGDPIASLAADLSDLPLGNNALFTDSPDHTHGILTWTPALADSGDYNVEFRATNMLTAARTTAIHVRGFDITGVPAGTAGRSPAFSAVVRPNPLGANSKLQLVTTRPGPVQVRLFDAQGRLVREVLAEGSVEPGDHQLPLRIEDGLGRKLRSGVYYYRVEAAEGVLTGRLAVLK